VTRLWYIREVDPYEKVMTGMTRDGCFLLRMGGLRARRETFASISRSSECSKTSNCWSALRATGEEAFEMIVPRHESCDFCFSEVTKF